jgi:hypothetical protein
MNVKNIAVMAAVALVAVAIASRIGPVSKLVYGS